MRRCFTLALSLAGVAALAAPAVIRVEPRLIWNVTASAPVGLYAIETGGTLRLGDLVSVTPPPDVANFIVARGYLPPGVPMLKRVIALPGQSVCRVDALVTVDGAPAGAARYRDARGRPLPDWQGCRVVGPDQVFLMNPLAPDSLDGRYFGPLPASAVRGRAIPILTDPDGDGRFHWRSDDPETARFFQGGDSR